MSVSKMKPRFIDFEIYNRENLPPLERAYCICYSKQFKIGDKVKMVNTTGKLQATELAEATFEVTGIRDDGLFILALYTTREGQEKEVAFFPVRFQKIEEE